MYVCTTGGVTDTTPGSTGPTTTGTNIVDGSAHFDYVSDVLTGTRLVPAGPINVGATVPGLAGDGLVDSLIVVAGPNGTDRALQNYNYATANQEGGGWTSYPQTPTGTNATNVTRGYMKIHAPLGTISSISQAKWLPSRSDMWARAVADQCRLRFPITTAFGTPKSASIRLANDILGVCYRL